MSGEDRETDGAEAEVSPAEPLAKEEEPASEDAPSSEDTDRPSLWQRVAWAVMCYYFFNHLIDAAVAMSAAESSAEWWNQLLWVGTHLGAVCLLLLCIVSPSGRFAELFIGLPFVVLLAILVFLLVCGRVLHFFVNLSIQ